MNDQAAITLWPMPKLQLPLAIATATAVSKGDRGEWKGKDEGNPTGSDTHRGKFWSVGDITDQ